MTNRFMKDRESYSGFSLEVAGVKRGKLCLLIFQLFQGFEELFFVLYDNTDPRV